ncbi:sulfotransferase domain-containing protein [Microbulbifer taiwanensis]|uniref:Sulfotransferase domain-containing protein n=1 Tax=Microbulbifer taiwanensis TaxID=986746 RepID=A0ABW1YPY5_9GAMM|nr:sulfotransferase domain-containing protein [Microbulbifer taiwanensis]
MLWNKNFLFLHYPKTAGKSLTKVFVNSWERPIKGYLSRGQFNELQDCDQNGLELNLGRGHENMGQALGIMSGDGVSYDDLTAIFICMRNPYDLMVSNYHFMRKTFKQNKDNKNFQAAVENSFEDYCSLLSVASPLNWFTIEGKVPEKMELIRFEGLSDNIADLCRKYGFSMPDIPHLNKSEHTHFSEYVTEKAEEEIYKKFNFFFESGFYSRYEGLK